MGQSTEPNTGDLRWRIASASGGGNCVQVAALPDGIAVRDSKNPDGPPHFYGKREWRAFMAAIRSEGRTGPL
jgi:hypothetical protein